MVLCGTVVLVTAFITSRDQIGLRSNKAVFTDHNSGLTVAGDRCETNGKEQTYTWQTSRPSASSRNLSAVNTLSSLALPVAEVKESEPPATRKPKLCHQSGSESEWCAVYANEVTDAIDECRGMRISYPVMQGSVLQVPIEGMTGKMTRIHTLC